MTDFTLSSGSICRPLRSPWGAFPVRALRTESTMAAAIQIGRPVVLLADASSNTDCIKGVAANTPNYFYIAGIAAEAVSSGTSSGTLSPKVSVWEANPAVEFKAVTKGGTLGSSLVGSRRSLVFDSTLNIAWVDVTGSTAADWRVIVTDLIDSVGDSGGYVAFRFVQSLAGNVASSVALTSTTPVLAFFG